MRLIPPSDTVMQLFFYFFMFSVFLKTTWWTRLKFLYVDKSSGFLIISCSPTDDVFYQLEMIKNGFYRLPLPLKVTFQHSSSWEGRRAVRAVRRVKMSTAGTSSRRWTQPILQFLSIPNGRCTIITLWQLYISVIHRYVQLSHIHVLGVPGCTRCACTAKKLLCTDLMKSLLKVWGRGEGRTVAGENVNCSLIPQGGEDYI